MRKTLCWFLAVTVLICVLSLSTACAEEDTLVMESYRTVHGSITSIDETNSTLVVRWLADNVMIKFEDLVLSVSKDTWIIKNGEKIEFGDIESGDSATVRYNPNAVPLPKALSISIEE